MKEIPLTQGYVALVDDEDYERVACHKWSVHKYADLRYAFRNVDTLSGRKKQHMHRLIMSTPEGMETDHINGNGLDNRRSNLRVCTHGQNRANTKKNVGGTSQFRGVHWSSRHGKWISHTKANGRDVHIGVFDNEIVAALAYDVKASELFGEFARLNFPQIVEGK